MRNPKKESSGAENVLTVQNAVQGVEAKIKGIRDKLTAEERFLTQAKSLKDELSTLEVKRGEVLADIATEALEQSALTAVDEEIATTRQALADHNAKHATPTGEVEALVGGLQRRLGEAEAELKNLKQDEHKQTEFFLRSEAERIGAEYADAALKVAATFRQLQALAQIFEPFRNPHDAPLSWLAPEQKIAIPLFRLDCHAPLAHPHFVDLLGEAVCISNNTPDGQRAADLNAERQRLTALGVRL